MTYASSTPTFFSKGSVSKASSHGYPSTRESYRSIMVSSTESIYNIGITHFSGVVVRGNVVKRPNEDSLAVWFANTVGRLASSSRHINPRQAFEHSYKLLLYFVAETLKSPVERVNNMSPWCFREQPSFESAAQQQLQELSRCYPTTTQRLCSFIQEVQGWDGADGKPASIRTFNDVKELLTCALLHDLSEPDVVLGIDGTIGVVWSNSDWYIAHDFSGSGRYIVVAMNKRRVAASGAAKVSEFKADVLSILKQNFMDDDRTNLR